MLVGIRVWFAFARWRRLVLCERVNDLPPNPCGVLLASIDQNNNTELPLRGKPYVGRGVIETAVLVDDGEVASADDLLGETYC